MKLDVLFFAAHPDDIELSCGGTVIKFVKSNKRAGIIDLTRGELGTRGTAKIRHSEVEKASKVMGIEVRENMHLPDGNIEINLKNKTDVIKIIRHYKPEIIFLPYPDDRHPDHINSSNLIKDAAFYSGLQKIETKKGGKIQKPHRPKKNIYFMQSYTFEPSFIIDISDEFNKKMEAIRCYSSQFYNPNSKEPNTFISDKNFIEHLEARAKFYGFQIGAKYGEPFYMKEKVKMDILSL